MQEREFVAKVRDLFLAPACVQASFSAADEKLAVELHRRGVELEQMALTLDVLALSKDVLGFTNAV